MPSLIQRPAVQESGDYFKGYINQVEGEDIMQILTDLKVQTSQLLENLSTEKWDFAYAPGKWTIKEMIVHLIDAERVFSYRALRFARNDQTPLPGFDQDDYTPESRAHQRSIDSIIREYKSVRDASLSLFESLDEKAWKNIGTASNSPFSPLALAFVIAGHEIHHMKILRERYLV